MDAILLLLDNIKKEIKLFIKICLKEIDVGCFFALMAFSFPIVLFLFFFQIAQDKNKDILFLLFIVILIPFAIIPIISIIISFYRLYPEERKKLKDYNKTNSLK